MAFSLDYRAHSEIGLVRKNNQDSGYVSPHMVLVADGMGGAAAGDLASTVAVQQIRKIDGEHPLDDAHTVLAGALSRANDTISDLVDADPALDGMGTTVTGALLSGTQLAMIHIGDSRAYLWRGGRLARLTHDHSWVQSLVDEGKISEADAAVHPHRSLLLKVLNGQANHEPDLDTVQLALDDRLLFCSDGLCGFVDEAEIARILDGTSLDEAVERLTAAAHRGGGADNITVLLADVLPNDPALAALEPITVGAASDRAVPIIEHHTLSGAEGIQLVPEPVATGERVVEPDELDDETLRYAPRPGGRRALLWTIGLLTTAAVITAAALWGGWRYTQNQFYVGEHDGQVAIYQGIPGRVFGVDLSKVSEQEPTKVADLPRYYRQQVRDTITVRDLAAGRETAEQLGVKAEQCIAQRARRTKPPTPTPGPSTPASSGSGAPSMSTSPTTTASVSSTTTTSAPATPSSTASPEQAVTASPTTIDEEC